jgi:hypothetical protein
MGATRGQAAAGVAPALLPRDRRQISHAPCGPVLRLDFAPDISQSRALWFVAVFLLVYGLMRVFRRKLRT